MTDEQKETTEKAEQATPTSDSNEGVQSKTGEFLQRLEELKGIDESLGKKLEEMRELQANTLLSGSAGIRPAEKPVADLTPAEYKDKLMRGEFK